MTKILYQLESYQIMGVLFDVHRNLGGGFSEIVYKDALEYEFKKVNIPFEREKEYLVITKTLYWITNFTPILFCLIKLYLK